MVRSPLEHSNTPSCPQCPICEGQMEMVYERFSQKVCVCVECHSGLTIPVTAWDIRRIKQSKKTALER